MCWYDSMCLGHVGIHGCVGICKYVYGCVCRFIHELKGTSADRHDACIHTYMLMYVPTHKHIMYKCIIWICIYIYIYNIHTYSHTYACRYQKGQDSFHHTECHRYVCTCMSTNTHVFIHTYTHKHTHTQTHKPACIQISNRPRQLSSYQTPHRFRSNIYRDSGQIIEIPVKYLYKHKHKCVWFDESCT